MRARFITELAEGSRVEAAYLLRGREMRAARNGDAYLALELADRSGAIPALLFRPRPEAAAIPVGSVVRASGTVTTFRGVRRISLDSLAPADSWDSEDLIASATRPREEMVAEFSELVRSVTEAGLRKLLRHVFGDKDFFERFSSCPASQSFHHAYLGGLLEHTNSVASACSWLAPRYDGVDRDLLVTAALLHDIGKVDELSYDTGIEFTDEGRLVGHVVRTSMRLHEAASRTRLDAELRVRLEHAVVSHHGELEWGSPKRPVTYEALLLHHADNLDAKAAGFADYISGAARVEERWTDASNLFRRPLYAPAPAQDDRPPRANEDAQHFQMSA